MARSKKGKHPATQPSGIKPFGVAYAPPRIFPFDPNHETIVRIAQSLPPGLLSIVANESARYTFFWGDLLGIVLPFGTRYSLHTGCYVVDSCNRAYSKLKEGEDWVMLMGDDHRFPPEIVLKLVGLMYENDLDIITPLCFKRDFPPTPVVYRYQKMKQKDPRSERSAWNEKKEMGLVPINLNDFPQGGLIEVDGVGSAGMVVRRRVIEKMEPPWFRFGVGHWGEDLHFCRRAQDLGFKIWVDLDMPLGHIVNATTWPMHNDRGEWVVEYDFNTKGGFRLAL